MWIIVGLGNPGERYAHTRHNVGYDVIEQLALDNGATLKRNRAARCYVAETRIGMLPGGAPGPKAILARTESYMNESGGPVNALLKYFGATPTNLLVIHDELDLEPHQLRLKLGGGEGGHNGLRSISSATGTRNYHRLRVGIGRPPGQMDTVDYVLGRFPSREATDWQITIGTAAEVANAVVTQGFETAQRELHTQQ